MIWLSSAVTGKILRIDTRTFEIEASFYTGPIHGDGCYGASYGFPVPAGDSPSREVVDEQGDVIVANRACNGQASITKIARDSDRCLDRNGDGRIRTSRGWDETLAFDSHDSWEDECILWHSVVGEIDGVARAIALEPPGSIDDFGGQLGWVGLFNEQRFLQFDATTGELTGAEIGVVGLTPYEMAIDALGTVWTTGDHSRIAASFSLADRGANPYLEATRGSPMRVIVDERGLAWMNDFLYLWRWVPSSGSFGETGVRVNRKQGNITSDGRGSIWIGTNEWSVLRVPNRDPTAFHRISLPNEWSFGVMADFDGHVWIMDGLDGPTYVVDIDDEELHEVLDDCGGERCLIYPYVRGDATGLQRVNALYGSGSWSRVFEACSDGPVEWTELVVEGATPEGTELAIDLRTAATNDELATAPLASVSIDGRPEDRWTIHVDRAFAEQAIAHERLLEVRVTLHSTVPGTSPSVRHVQVESHARELDAAVDAPGP